MARQQGFTLIEMLVVLAVLALIVGIVVSHGPERSAALELRQTAALVAQTMRGARAAAIAAGRSVDVRIDTAGHTIQAGAATALLLPGTVALAITLASGAPVRARYAAFRFAPDGSASGGGVLLAEGPLRSAVAIDWLTGRVRSADAR